MGELVCMQGCLFFTFILMGGERYSDWGRILGSFRGFGAILANKWTVSGLNMTHNAFYHLNKV